MEIRMRSAVSRTAKGYSVEATLDMGAEYTAEQLNFEGAEKAGQFVVDWLSAFQIAKLKEHMEALGKAFPKEE